MDHHKIASSSSTATLPRRAPSDVFRPRLPLDPFSQPVAPTPRVHVDPDAPWPVRDLPQRTAAFAAAPRVLLVLGSPSPHALAPLLRSPTFAGSLLLLVTHAPPPGDAFVGSVHPAVRILRLSAPLAPAAPTFALTLVHVLDAAAAIARAWRAAPPPPDIRQLAQDPDGAFAVPEPLASAPYSSFIAPPLPTSEHLHAAGSARGAPPSPPASLRPPARARPPSALSLGSSTFSASASASTSASAPASPTRRDSTFSTLSAASKRSSKSYSSQSSPNSHSKSSSSKSKSHSKSPSGASAADGTRALDALLCFLPPGQPEKAVLKQVVLVSTLAGAFLTGRAFASASASGSTFGNTNGNAYSSAAPSRRGSIVSLSLSAGWNSASAPTTPGGFSPSSYGGGSASTSTSRPGSFIGSQPGSANTSRPGSFIASGPPSRSSSPSPSTRRSRFFGLGKRGSESAPRLVEGVYDDEQAGGGGGAMRDGGIAGGGRVRAHIIHVLPASYRAGKLTGALGAFLASYSPAPSPSSHSGGDDYDYSGGENRGPAAYVLAERALREVESVLVGALDASGGGGGGERGGGGGGGRGAWVAGVLPAPGSLPSGVEREREGQGREREGREGPPSPSPSTSAEDEVEVDLGHPGDSRQRLIPEGFGGHPETFNSQRRDGEDFHQGRNGEDFHQGRSGEVHPETFNQKQRAEEAHGQLHPYGLPTPPESRNGSGEGEGEGEEGDEGSPTSEGAHGGLMAPVQQAGAGTMAPMQHASSMAPVQHARTLPAGAAPPALASHSGSSADTVQSARTPSSTSQGHRTTSSPPVSASPPASPGSTRAQTQRTPSKLRRARGSTGADVGAAPPSSFPMSSSSTSPQAQAQAQGQSPGKAHYIPASRLRVESAPAVSAHSAEGGKGATSTPDLRAPSGRRRRWWAFWKG